MHFHFCGNPFHDVPMNILAMLTVFPEWMPWAREVGRWAARRLKTPSGHASPGDR